MLFTNKQFSVRPGQPVKLVFLNPDATDHNLVLVQPGAMEEVGVAANAMARDPKNATSDFIPEEKEFDSGGDSNDRSYAQIIGTCFAFRSTTGTRSVPVCVYVPVTGL